MVMGRTSKGVSYFKFSCELVVWTEARCAKGTRNVESKKTQHKNDPSTICRAKVHLVSGA